MEAYIICSACKVGSRDDDGAGTKLFAYGHSDHGQLEYVDAAIFLSDHVARGYVDTDRPTAPPPPMLKSIDAPTFAEPERATPFGRPASRDQLFAENRAMRAHFQPMPRVPLDPEPQVQPSSWVKLKTWVRHLWLGDEEEVEA